MQSSLGPKRFFLQISGRKFAFARLHLQPPAMLRRLLQHLNFVGRWRARQAERRRFDALSAEYHRQSRARVAELAAQGRSDEALKESLSVLGIDVTSTDRPRIVGCNGVRFRD